MREKFTQQRLLEKSESLPTPKYLHYPRSLSAEWISQPKWPLEFKH